MVAGGTGFAPLNRCCGTCSRGVSAAPSTSTGARVTRQDLYEEAQVLEWARRYPQLTFTAVLSEATGLEATHHRVGWVHEAVLADHARPQRTSRCMRPDRRR